LEQLQRLLAALTLFQQNLKILHWNIVGIDFDSTHALLGDYYDDFEDFIDDTAEFCKTLNVSVLNLNDVISILEQDSISFVSLNGDESFTSKDCFVQISDMFEILIKIYDDVLAVGNIPGSIVNKMQEHQQWLRKECQFKNKQRLK